MAVAIVDRRITPTGVGRTRLRMRGDPVVTDHPHGRGEDTGYTLATVRTHGSPPRAWGGPVKALFSGLSSRITPTGVGRTLSDLGF